MQSCLQPSPEARLFAAAVVLILLGCCYAHAQEQPAGRAGDAQIARAVGTIKSIQTDSVTLVSDSGGEVTAKLASSTRILRVPPGEKDLDKAIPLQLQDLQPGDRVLVRGQASADGGSIAALAVIVMKQADVSVKREHEREDWQKRGVGGLVSTVDMATGTITISSGGLGGNRSIAVHTTKDTVVRRYALDSVRFDDARPAPLDQIKPGDQLRARGRRSEDNSELTAEEIVFGTFRNIAGTITAIDLAANSMTVQDAINKSAVVVNVSLDSQMKTLPQEIAQRIAMRLKASTSEGADQGPAPQSSRSSAGGATPEVTSRLPRGPSGTQSERGNSAPDLQRLLSRLPSGTLSDLHKGEAVMMVSTLGEGSGPVKAITLLAGVEPILAATPNRSASMMLSPWALGGSSGEAEAVP
jgi:hypothetical protein